MARAFACRRTLDGLRDAVSNVSVGVVDAHQAVALADIAAGDCRAVDNVDAVVVPASITLEQGRQFASVTLGRDALADDLAIITTSIKRAASGDTARHGLRIEPIARRRREAFHGAGGALTWSERVAAATVTLEPTIGIGVTLHTHGRSCRRSA